MAIADDAGPDAAEPAGYPAEWEFDGLLRNGEAVAVRPIRPADAPALVGLRAATSPGTHQHVLLAGPALSLPAAVRFSEVDYDARMAFVALVSDELIGLASYDRPDARVPAAEASFIVAGADRATASRPCCSRAWRSTRGPGGSCASPPRSERRTRPCSSCLPRPACAAPGVTAWLRCGSRSTCGRRRRTVRRAISGRRWRRSPASRRSSGHARSRWSERDGTRATSGIRWSGPCLPVTSRAPSTRLTRPPGRSAACPRSRRCCRYPSRSTWPSSPFPHQLSPP